MSTINDLAVISTVSSTDKLPVWSNANGVTRGLPLSVLDSRYVTQDSIGLIPMSATVETFVSGVNFTPGTTIALTLANLYYTAANIEVFFDAAYQGPDQYTLAGYGLVFSTPIPVGVGKVFVRGGAARLVGAPSDGTVTSAKISAGPGKYWATDSPPAQIWRMTDRVFIGTAAKNDGNSTQLVGDWTQTQYSVGTGSFAAAFAYMEHWATLSVGSPNGQPTIVAATRSSDSGGAGNAAFAIGSVVVNDNVFGAGANTWNYYGTTVRAAGATGQSTIGYEQDVTNLGSAVPIFPSHLFLNGVTANLWIAAGGELANQTGTPYTFANVSCAMAIFANAQPGATNCVYDKGIVFGANGLNSNGIAIAFAAGHNMGWFNSSDQQCASIQAPVTTIAAGQQMVISNFGTLFNDMSGNTQFRIANGITSAANYLMTTASVAGSNPTLSTAGSDTNIDLSLVPQGSGNVKFGIYTASVVSQAGYITIKDASGTVRRLLVG